MTGIGQLHLIDGADWQLHLLHLLLRQYRHVFFALFGSAVTRVAPVVPRALSELKYAQSTHYYVRYGNFQPGGYRSCYGSFIARPTVRIVQPSRYVLRRRSAELCQLACLLPHPYANDENGSRTVFIPPDDRYQVGFITINPMSSSTVSAANILKIDDFTVALQDQLV